jgi:hypothetical protein
MNLSKNEKRILINKIYFEKSVYDTYNINNLESIRNYDLIMYFNYYTHITLPKSKITNLVKNIGKNGKHFNFKDYITSPIITYNKRQLKQIKYINNKNNNKYDCYEFLIYYLSRL